MEGTKKVYYMRVEGWVLRGLSGIGETSCWADHDCVAKERVRGGNGKAVYGWYPRDNAYFGACCYCGAGCPEEMQGAYLMMNADVIHHWTPRPWARQREEELNHG